MKKFFKKLFENLVNNGRSLEMWETGAFDDEYWFIRDDI